MEQNTGGNANSTYRTCLTCGKKDEAMDSCEICNPKGMIGWVCPVCGRGNSPFSSTCPCKGFTSYPVYGSAGGSVVPVPNILNPENPSVNSQQNTTQS